MEYKRGQICYILENNIRVSKAVILDKRGKFCTIRLEESNGAIRLPESRIFFSEEEAMKSKKTLKKESYNLPDRYGFIDVFNGRRKGKSPH